MEILKILLMEFCKACSTLGSYRSVLFCKKFQMEIVSKMLWKFLLSFALITLLQVSLKVVILNSNTVMQKSIASSYTCDSSIFSIDIVSVVAASSHQREKIVY